MDDMSYKSPTDKFQKRLIKTVSEAADDGVNPSVVYTMLGSIQLDVLHSIKQMSRETKNNEAQKTAAEIIDEHESKIRPAGSAN
jgi:hypothetical protein